MNPCSFGISPKRILASGEQDGYRWEVVVNHMAYRCGYVRIPKGHPWWGEDAFQLDVQVHGGLTYDAYGVDEDALRDQSEYWIGFDCAHAGDAADPSLIDLLPPEQADACRKYLEIIGERPAYLFQDKIRTTEYCEEQCRHIIAQAIRAAALETTVLGWTPKEPS